MCSVCQTFRNVKWSWVDYTYIVLAKGFYIDAVLVRTGIFHRPHAEMASGYLVNENKLHFKSSYCILFVKMGKKPLDYIVLKKEYEYRYWP